MQELLRKGEVIAACDASVKDGVMGAYWVIMTRKNKTLLSHEMHAKDWSYSTPKTAEAVILLDLITTLQSRAQNTNNGRVDIHVDNKETWRRVTSTTRVANHFNQDSAAEVKAIKSSIRKADLEISLIRQHGHRDVIQNDQNPGPKLIKMCDEKAKQVRKRAVHQSTSNNMRYFGEKALMKGDQLASMPIKELIRAIDAEEEEKEYAASKFKELKHLVDMKARKHLKKIPLSASALKCYYG